MIQVRMDPEGGIRIAPARERGGDEERGPPDEDRGPPPRDEEE